MPALRRLVAANVEGGRTVVLLSRTREPVSGHKQKWAELCSVGLPFDAIGRVSGSTVHKFKGKEAHTVIIVDASARSFPKLSPVWTLFRIFGDSIASLVEDERQLLYVAATRAADNVICVVDTGRKNGDLSELFGEGGERFTPVDWTSLPMPRRDGRRSCLVVVSNLQTRSGRRGGTHAVKEQLKMASFTYSTEGGPQWSRSEPLDEDGGVEQILRRIRIEDWAIKGDGLVIELLIGRENSLGMYTVIEGHWTEL